MIFCDPWFLILVYAHLSKWSPLSDFADSFWQRQHFTSQLNLNFWMCMLIMSLRRLAQLLGSIIGWGNCLSSQVGRGRFFQWHGSLPKWDCKIGFRITRWSGMVTILSSRWGCNLVSLLSLGTRVRPRACMAYCLRSQIREEEYALNVLFREGYLLLHR